MDVKVSVELGTGGRFNYVVTTASGYRAVMEVCDRDLCADGTLKPCERELNDKHMHSSGEGSGSVDKWIKHSAVTCHGWHNARIQAFAAAVARTYGSYRRPTLAALQGRRKPGSLNDVEREKLLLGAMTVDEYRDELAKAAA